MGSSKSGKNSVCTPRQIHVATFLCSFWFSLQNYELTHLPLFLVELLFSLKLSKQGTYTYIGPDSHLHHGPITPRGQQVGDQER